MVDTIIGIAGTAGVSLIGWLYHQYASRNKAITVHLDKVDTALHNVEDRTLVIETTVKRQEPTLDEVKRQQTADAIRLASVEIAVGQIKQSFATMELRHGEISAKLDRIPELTVALQNFQDMAKNIVPRPEVDSRFDAIDQRLDGIVVSVREVREVKIK
jgi:hypothetical protein